MTTAGESVGNLHIIELAVLVSLLFTFLVPASSLRVPVLRVVCLAQKNYGPWGGPSCDFPCGKEIVRWLVGASTCDLRICFFFLISALQLAEKMWTHPDLKEEGKTSVFFFRWSSWSLLCLSNTAKSKRLISYDDFIRILELQISLAFTPLWSSYFLGVDFFFGFIFQFKSIYVL